MKLLFFSTAAEWMGCRELSLKVRAKTTVRELVETQPELAPLKRRLKGLRVAVNLEYTDWEAGVGDGDEVAFIPPVSGG